MVQPDLLMQWVAAQMPHLTHVSRSWQHKYINLDDLDQAEFHAEKGHNILKIVKYDMVGMGLLENIKSRKMAKSSGKSK